MNKEPQEATFVLPTFDLPQREDGGMDRWTYEDAARTIEEMAKAFKLWEIPRREGEPSTERFVM